MPALTPQNDAVRAINVSASEVGALLGPHPYTNPQRIYDRLMGPAGSDSGQTESMALGVFFERRIAQYAASRLGIRVRANSRTIAHPIVPLCATPDYIVLKQRMLVECKLSSIMYGWSEDDLAPHIEWQARAQMACTDRDVCFIAALVGSKFYTIPVVRDHDKERTMLIAVELFWAEHMYPGVRPPDPEIPHLRKITIEASSKG
jgi:predicted phage-related endonuclease